jgi:hypothetical protein
VALVEPLRVDAVQPLHARREVGDFGGEDEMVMRVHQAVRVQLPGKPLAGNREQVEEIESIEIGEEDG